MNDKTPETLSDPALSALYRRISTETCPDTVNDTVLRAAGERTRPRWQVPLAMAATIVVAAMVGREINDSAGVAAPTAADTASEPPAVAIESAPQPAMFENGEDRRVSLDALRPDPAAVRQQVQAASERAEQEVDAGLMAGPLDDAAPERAAAAPEQSRAAGRSRLQAPPDPALAERLSEASFADLAETECAADSDSLDALVVCWRALSDAGRKTEAETLRKAIQQRFPEAVLPVTND